jgi:hypothetical protein
MALDTQAPDITKEYKEMPMIMGQAKPRYAMKKSRVQEECVDV